MGFFMGVLSFCVVSRKSRAHYHMGGSAKYIGPSLELQKVSKNFIPNSKLAAVIILKYFVLKTVFSEIRVRT